VANEADRAARGLIAALRVLTSTVPGMFEQQAGPGVFAVVSGIPIPTLNGVVTDLTDPDVAAIDRAAAVVAPLGLPWSIQFRGEPSPAAERVAASAHGRDPDPSDLTGPAPDRAALRRG